MCCTCLPNSVRSPPPQVWWLNPGEELVDRSEGEESLRAALEALGPAGDRAPSADAVAAALVRAATHPEVRT